MRKLLRRKEKEQPLDDSDSERDEYEILSTKDIVMTTTESEIELKNCKVQSDHFIAYSDNKVHKAKKRKPRILQTPKVLILPVWEILSIKGDNFVVKFFKRIIIRWSMPKYLRFRTYTVRREGEATHDPHNKEQTPDAKLGTHDPHEDNYPIETKMKLEQMLKLEGKFAESNAGAEIYEGMKGKPKWYDYIPYLVLFGVVALFLFAFQIQPNL